MKKITHGFLRKLKSKIHRNKQSDIFKSEIVKTEKSTDLMPVNSFDFSLANELKKLYEVKQPFTVYTEKTFNERNGKIFKFIFHKNSKNLVAISTSPLHGKSTCEFYYIEQIDFVNTDSNSTILRLIISKHLECCNKTASALCSNTITKIEL